MRNTETMAFFNVKLWTFTILKHTDVQNTHNPDTELLKCNDFNLTTTNIFELEDHVEDFYTTEIIIYRMCVNIHESKGELMKHIKNENKENVMSSWKFEEGHCTFGDVICWFLYSILVVISVEKSLKPW